MNSLLNSAAGHSTLRIGWCVEAADYDIAGFRYRCLAPALALEGHGCRSVLLDLDSSTDNLDFVVFVKTFGREHLQLADSLARIGIPFALDLCDNIFAQGYHSKLKFVDVSAFRAMAKLAAVISVPGEALARAVRENIPDCVDPVVIPDAALSEADHYALSRWHARSELRSLEPGGRVANKLTTMMQAVTSMRRKLRYYGRHPKSALTEIKHLVGRNAESSWNGNGNGTDGRTRKVIWFGKHGTSHSDAGMKGLLVTIPYLQAAQKRAPIELVIISNNRAKFAAHFSALGIKTRYCRWSNEAVYQEMRGAAAFLMPNATDSFSACKSANRALLALACEVPVIATQLESLDPLKDVIVLDDWRRGLDRYLFDDAARRHDVALAGEIIRRDFCLSAIGNRWHARLQQVAVQNDRVFAATGAHAE